MPERNDRARRRGPKPAADRKPSWLRLAEKNYAKSLALPTRAERDDAASTWEDKELFDVAHLSFLNLRAQASLYAQNQQIISLLGRLVEQGADIRAVCEDLAEGMPEVLADRDEADEDDEDEDDDDEEDDEDDDEEDEDDEDEADDEDDDGEEEPVAAPPPAPAPAPTPPPRRASRPRPSRPSRAPRAAPAAPAPAPEPVQGEVIVTESPKKPGRAKVLSHPEPAADAGKGGEQ